MDPKQTEPQQQAYSGPTDPPKVEGVDNDNGQKKFKLNNPNQKVRISGQNFSRDVTVKLTSTDDFKWEPETQPARSTANGTRINIKSKPKRRGHGADDTGDLTVQVTNEPSGPSSNQYKEQVEYEP